MLPVAWWLVSAGIVCGPPIGWRCLCQPLASRVVCYPDRLRATLSPLTLLSPGNASSTFRGACSRAPCPYSFYPGRFQRRRCCIPSELSLYVACHCPMTSGWPPPVAIFSCRNFWRSFVHPTPVQEDMAAPPRCILHRMFARCDAVLGSLVLSLSRRESLGQWARLGASRRMEGLHPGCISTMDMLSSR